MLAPRLSYLICTTPRSGSTLLCEALANTTVAGRPEEYYQHRRKTGLPRRPLEYFEEAVPSPEVRDILGEYTRVDDEWLLNDPRRFPSYGDYVAWTIAQGTTPNAVFGAKVMWGYFNGFVDRLRDMHGNAVMPTTAVLARTFPRLEGWIFLTREDKVRQAVSLWKAIQTWTWRRDEGDGRVVRHDLRYSFDAIDHLARQLDEHEREWGAFFEQHGLEPLTVRYEQLVADYEGTALAVLRHLGIQPPERLVFGPRRIARQSDITSEEWVERYLARAHAPLAGGGR